MLNLANQDFLKIKSVEEVASLFSCSHNLNQPVIECLDSSERVFVDEHMMSLMSQRTDSNEWDSTLILRLVTSERMDK